MPGEKRGEKQGKGKQSPDEKPGAQKHATKPVRQDPAAKADAETAPEAASAKHAERVALREARRAANQLEREARRAAKQAARAEKKARGGAAKPDKSEAAKPAAPKGQAAPKPKANAEAKPKAKAAPKPQPARQEPERRQPERQESERQPVVAIRDPGAVPRPAPQRAGTAHFNILIVGQAGRLGLEAVLFAASLRRNAPGWPGRLIVAEPQPQAAWEGVQTQMPDAIRAALSGYGAEIAPLTARRFGKSYPYGNKIEALSLLPAGEPFFFFDSDTLITGDLAGLDLDFARPSASMRRQGTWPEPPLYGPGYGDIWKSLYDRFGLDFATSLDQGQPDEHWEHYLYFNAGWFFGADPQEFGRRFLEYALAIRDEPGDALACQSLDPWLDQVALPLVVHALGGGRPGPELAGLDGDVTCHYRNLSLLYARESDAVVDLIEELAMDPAIAPLLQGDEAVQRLILAGEGRRVLRPIFAEETPAPTEQVMRNRLRREGLWFR